MYFYLYTNQPLPGLPEKAYVLRPTKQLSAETEEFPFSAQGCYPTLPKNLLIPFCQRAKKRPALLIQSADYTVTTGHYHLLSEQAALTLAQEKQAKIYHDSISDSAYFCYLEQQEQHIVWIEDGFHLLKKIRFLQKERISEIALPVSENNIKTITSLILLFLY